VGKLCVTAGGAGMKIMREASEVLTYSARTLQRYGPHLIQEYVPGRNVASLYLLRSLDGALMWSMMPKVMRVAKRFSRTTMVLAESAPAEPDLLEAANRLLTEMDLWGSATIQGKFDPRDGVFKLIEVNPRVGDGLWQRLTLGVNEPLVLLKLARGEAVAPLPPAPAGHRFVRPAEDVLSFFFALADLAVFKIRTKLLRRRPFDPFNPPTPLRALLASYWSTYAGSGPRHLSPDARYALRDPIPSILFWILLARLYANKALRQIGR
jgi:hypothetical protein